MDEDYKILPNANQKGEKLTPVNYQNALKAKSNVHEFTVEKNKSQLLYYYNKIESDMDLLKKEMNSMKNKLQHLENMQQKVKGDLLLLGVEVKEVTRKDKE